MARDAPYAAYIECDDHAIVSALPELFFEREGGTILSKPMKGTAPRGLMLEEDIGRREQHPLGHIDGGVRRR
ncbi:MAG TPA: chorismate-binding protein [Woeseiaceae bacterium]|jgi:para-aminobenzoate synthetase/4-amino-4-deoxychorismate lyase|nr:chorismate-binding protein [Woeseiaceae bacterium]